MAKVRARRSRGLESVSGIRLRTRTKVTAWRRIECTSPLCVYGARSFSRRARVIMRRAVEVRVTNICFKSRHLKKNE